MNLATSTYGEGTQALVQKGPLLAGGATATTANATVHAAAERAAQNPSRIAPRLAATCPLVGVNACRGVSVAIRLSPHRPTCLFRRRSGGLPESGNPPHSAPSPPASGSSRRLRPGTRSASRPARQKAHIR